MYDMLAKYRSTFATRMMWDLINFYVDNNDYCDEASCYFANSNMYCKDRGFNSRHHISHKRILIFVCDLDGVWFFKVRLVRPKAQ